MLTLFSITGLTKLEVENRFIDHFKSTTEIYRGMEIIDQQLGGTTPLDIIIDPDALFYEIRDELRKEDAVFEDEFDSGGKNDYNE